MRALHKLAIKVGCPSSIFWDDDPSFFWDYVDAYIEAQEDKVTEMSQSMDYQAWLYGAYMVHALTNFGIMTSKPTSYPTEPFSYSRQERKKEKNAPEQVDDEKEIEKQQLELMAALLSYNQRL